MKNVFEEQNYFTEESIMDTPIYFTRKIDDTKIPDKIIYTDINESGGGGGIKNTFRAFTYSGIVRDATSELPIPSATVILYANGTRIGGGAANSKGEFAISTDTEATHITISSVGYKTWNWPASTYQHLFELERDVKDLDPVVVTTTKKNNALLWIALIVVGYMATKK